MLHQMIPLGKRIKFATNFAAVETLDELKALTDKLYSDDNPIGFDIETGYSGADFKDRSTNVFNDHQFIAGFSITNDPTWARYVPLKHDFANNLDPNKAWEVIQPLMEEKPTVAHNCFTGDTKAIVRGFGAVALRELGGQTAQVWTDEGWRDAKFRNYGKSSVREVVLAPGNRSRSSIRHSFLATPNHRWVTTTGEYVTTDQLKAASKLPKINGTKLKLSLPEFEFDEAGFIHGLIFADGALTSRDSKSIQEGTHSGDYHHQLRLCGDKSKFSHLFNVTYPPSAGGDAVANYISHYNNCKELPPENSSDAYVASFLSGWLAMDGHFVSKSGSRILCTVNEDHALWARDNGWRVGLPVFGYSSHSIGSGYNTSATRYDITFASHEDASWRVISVGDASAEEVDVYCAEVVDGPDRFTLAGGILTGNCQFEAENLLQLDHKGDGPRINIFKGGAHDSMIQAYVLSDVPSLMIDGAQLDGEYVRRYLPQFHRLKDDFQDPKVKAFFVGLKSLTKFRYNYDQADIYSLFNGGKELTADQKKKIRFNTLPVDPNVVHYACDDAYLCLQLHRDQYERIQEDPYLPNVYNLEMKIAELLTEIREVGVSVDWEGIGKHKEIFEAYKDTVRITVRNNFEKETGVDQSSLNLRSTKQISNLLYGTREDGGLELPVDKRTKSGAPSTDDKALTSIRKMSPAVDSLLKYRQLLKMGEWFTLWDGLRDQTHDGKVHPSFMQTRIQSGRFASANPNCVKGDVEVLTPTGWVKFEDLEDGVAVAQSNEAGEISFVVPSAVIRKEFDGEGVQIKSHKGSALDIWMTPDHRVLSYTRDGNPVWETAGDWLHKWEGTHIIDRKLKRAGHIQGGRVLSAPELTTLELAVACQADGTPSGNFWSITVRRPRKVSRLNELGVGTVERPTRNTHTARVPKTDVQYWLSPDKTFKQEVILNLSEESLDKFMQMVMQWDGDSTRSNTFCQHPNRTPDVDLVQAVASLTGRSTSRYEYHRRDLDGTLVDTPYQTLNVNVKEDRFVSRVDVRAQKFSGVVYCVTVPTGAFLIRSKGTVLVTGNCQNITKKWWFQNIPGSIPEVMSKGTLGVDYWTGNARDFIIASPGYTILSFDYKSAEIQFLAALSQEDAIIQAFYDDEDFHKWTASLVFGKSIEEVTKKERQAAKAQPLSEPVLTPNGWVPMGNIRPGDFVIGSDGKPTRVVDIEPQGVKKIYRVETTDGSTRCTDEHLWTVRNAISGRGEWKTVELKDLIKKPLRAKPRKNGNGQGKWELPARPVIEFAPQDELPVDPYALGLLLGDGNLTHDWAPSYSSADREMLEYMRTYHESLGGLVSEKKRGEEEFWTQYLTCTPYEGGPRNVTRNPLRAKLKELGLDKKKAVDKFVPSMYLTATPEERLALLQGLLDTDGSVLNSGALFHNTSLALCEAVQELARSLGGKASVRVKRESSPDNTGKFASKLKSYDVYLRLPAGVNPFKLSRKAYKIKTPTRFADLRILDVVEEGEEECQCILVENEDGLYITKDFLVTHNTVSFGNIYGQSVAAMAQQLGISREEAQQIRDMYFARFPKLAKYFEDQHELVESTSEVRTWMGRKATIWEQMHSDRGVRSKAARMSVNIPVQGGATGDYTKMAMIRVRDALKKKGLWNDKVRLLMNQHDSLVFEVSNELDIREVIELMTPQVQFSLAGIQGCYNKFETFPPMSVDWEIGLQWGSVYDAQEEYVLDSHHLDISLSDDASAEDLAAITDVIITNPGDVPVSLNYKGQTIDIKYSVRAHPDVLGKLKNGDPDNGIPHAPGDKVSAKFRV